MENWVTKQYSTHAAKKDLFKIFFRINLPLLSLQYQRKYYLKIGRYKNLVNVTALWL